MGYDWQIGDELTAERLNNTGTAGMLTLTARENITANKAVWLANKKHVILDSSDVLNGTYVLSTAATSNFYPSDDIRCGGAGGTYRGFFEYDLTGTPSSADTIACYFVPMWRGPSNGGTGTITNITTSWDQTTVTHNTRPTVGAVSVAITGAGNVTGHRIHDITTIYNDAKDNTRYGFQIQTDGVSGAAAFTSQTNASSFQSLPAVHMEPYLIIVANDPNAGGVYTFSDLDDINQMSGFVGFAREAGTTGNPMMVQKSGILDGFAGLTAGQRYYVDTNGDLTTTRTILRAGTAISATELLIERPQCQLIKQLRVGAGSPQAGSSSLVEVPWPEMADWVHYRMKTKSAIAAYNNIAQDNVLTDYHDEFSDTNVVWFRDDLMGINDMSYLVEFDDSVSPRTRSQLNGTAGDDASQAVMINYYKRNW